MSIGEFFAVKREIFRFQWRAVRRYYPKSIRFALCDLAIGFASLFFNAYRVCRKQGSVYGETPFESLHRIAVFCALSSEDVWLELGSGRGRGCFWISHFMGCRTIGIEKSRLFCWLANTIRILFRVDQISFVREDMIDSDFSKVSFVYLYSTCMDETFLSHLTKAMRTLPVGAKVVTISTPLPNCKTFYLAGSFPISFPWGIAEGYFHQRIDDSSGF